MRKKKINLYSNSKWYGQFSSQDSMPNGCCYRANSDSLKAEKNYKSYLANIRKNKAAKNKILDEK